MVNRTFQSSLEVVWFAQPASAPFLHAVCVMISLAVHPCITRTSADTYTTGGCQSGRRRYADWCSTPLLQCLSDICISHGKACTRKGCQAPPQDHPWLPSPEADLSSWSAVTAFLLHLQIPSPPPTLFRPPRPTQVVPHYPAPFHFTASSNPCFGLSHLHLACSASV